MTCAVVFGGLGFIGLAQHLIDDHGYEKIYLFDRDSISSKESIFRKKLLDAYPQIKVIIEMLETLLIDPPEWLVL